MVCWSLLFLQLVNAQPEIAVISSDYTPMVSQITVGSSNDVLLVSLSFDTTDLFFYSPSMCPPFVKCLDIRSDSYEYIPEDVFASEQEGMVLDYASDLFSLGSDIAPTRLDFAIGYSKTNTGTKELDVAGRVGLGPGSAILNGKILRLRADIFNGSTALPIWQMSVISPEARMHPNQIQITTNLFGETDSWKFRTRITCGVPDRFCDIVASFVPDLADIVVPLNKWDSFVDYIFQTGDSLVNNDRLFVDCGSVFPTRRPSLRFGNRYLSIDHLLLQSAPTLIFTHEETRYCPTRIVRGMSWKFGISLLASVESVDFEDRRLRFNMLWSRRQRPDSVVPFSLPQFRLHMIPELSRPVLTTSASKVVIEFSHARSWTGDQRIHYLPTSRNGRQVSNGNIVFTFMGKRQTANPLTSSGKYQLPGIYHFNKQTGCETAQCLDGLQFEFVSAYDMDKPSYNVFLVDIGAHAILLVLHRVKARSTKDHFAIAAPTTWVGDKPGADPFCSICRCDYEPDDSVQSLVPACQHTFHVDCISAWLGEHTTCCICRSEIPYKKDKRKLLTLAT